MRTSQETHLCSNWLLSILNFEAHLKQFERTSIFYKYLKIKKEGIGGVSTQIQTKQTFIGLQVYEVPHFMK